MLIIGITGTSGAGKGTVTEYLVTKKGFRHYSARAFIVEEIERRGLPVDRDSMIAVSNDLRKKHSPSYIIEQYVLRAEKEGKNAVIESIRTEGEAELLHQKGALLISVDADQKIRYERIHARKNETDNVTFEEFQVQEEIEKFSADPGKHSISSVMKMADIHLVNNGTVEELECMVEEALAMTN
jgi:dephospho-CoA kinase